MEPPALVRDFQCSGDIQEWKSLADARNRLLAAFEKAQVEGGAAGGLEGLIEEGRTFFREYWPEAVRESIRSLETGSLFLDLDPNLVDFPWELAHDGRDFLGCRFAIGRSVMGWTSEGRRDRRDSSAAIHAILLANPTGDLPASAREGELLERILSVHEGVGADLLKGRITRSAFLDALGEYDLVHYSGHMDGAEGAVLWRLADGPLSPTEIEGLRTEGKGGPALFFNNACHTEAGSTLQPSPAKALTRAGCLHYIGVFSKVQDESARKFARIFYQHLLIGESVGRALLRAKLEVRAESGAYDLTWAQHLLYGDPTTGIFGESRVATEVRTLVHALAPKDEAGWTDVRSRLEEAASGFPRAEIVSSESSHTEFRILFDRPSEAVRYAITVAHRARSRGFSLAGLSDNPDDAETSTPSGGFRVGLHIGELSIEREAGRSGVQKIRGLAAEEAKRLVDIAREGQILLSRPVFDNARAVLAGNEIQDIDDIEWLDHGTYLFKGVESPIEVCEVGERGTAPLAPPPDTDKAYRKISPDQEPVLGWRPALGQTIPTSPNWKLTEKLGEGGFGEVWRAADSNGETRVFKFCFRADRVRALKREVTLFRLLRENVGDHPNIVRIHKVFFDEPPYFIEMEDAGSADLVRWCESNGGVENIADEVLFSIVRSVASALQAAHESGIIHRDVKPSNILVHGDPGDSDSIRVKLTDFGIGQVVSTSVTPLVTMTGFTETYGRTEMSSGTGSRLYLAPEITVGDPASIRSDLFSLGVVLYQLILRDFKRPLTSDWRDDIDDHLLREDLEGCVAGDPRGRFSSVVVLADRLANLEARRADRAKADEDAERSRRRQRITLIASSATAILLAISVALVFGLYQAWQAQDAAEEARGRAEEALAETEQARKEAEIHAKRAEREFYFASIRLAQQNIEELRFGEARKYLLGCPPDERHWEWGYLMAQCNRDVMTLHGHRGEVGAMQYSPDAKFVASADDTGLIVVWDLATGSERLRIEGHDGTGIWALDVSKNGKWIATGAEDSAARIWSATTGEELAALENLPSEVLSIRFRGEGRAVLIGTITGDLLLWSGLAGEEPVRIDSGFHVIEWIDWFTDGKRAVVAGEVGEVGVEGGRDTVSIVSIEDRTVEQSLRVEGKVRGVSVSPDGEFVAMTDINTKTSIYRWKEGIESRRHLGGERGGRVWSVEYSPDGERLASTSMDGTCLVYDVDSGEVVHRLLGHDTGVYRVSFSPDGQFVATSSGDELVKIWYVGDERSFERLPNFYMNGGETFITPEGKTLIASFERNAGNGSMGIHRFELPSGRYLGALYGAIREYASASLFPDSHRFAAFSPLEHRVRIWDLETEEEVGSFFVDNHGEQRPCRVSASPVGDRIAVFFTEGGMALHDIQTGRRIATGQNGGFTDSDLSFAWSPDGKVLYTGNGAGQRVSQLQLFSGEDLTPIDSVEAHSMGTRSIVLDPLGRWVATGSQDKTVALRPIEDLRNPIVLSSHSDFVGRIRFSHDGLRLFTTDRVGSLRVWRTSGDDPVELMNLESPEVLDIHSLAVDTQRGILALGLHDKTHKLLSAFDWTRTEAFGEGREAQTEEYKARFWRERLPRLPGVDHSEALKSQPSTLFRDAGIQNPHLREALELFAGREHLTVEEIDLRFFHSVDLRDRGIDFLEDFDKIPGLVSVLLAGNPISDFSSLQSHPNMVELDIERTDCTDLSFIRSFKKLKILKVSSPHPIDLSPVWEQTGLEELAIDGQASVDLSRLDGRHMIRLALPNCGLTDISPLARMERLQVLNLLRNEIADISVLGGLKDLRDVYMPINPAVAPDAVWTQPHLKRLTLHHTGVDNIEFVGGLHALEHLDIGSAPVESLVPLANCRNLKRLDASLSGVRSSKGFEELPDLYWVDLRGSRLRDVDGFKNPPSLKHADLGETPLESIAGFEGLDRLETINLAQTPLRSIEGIENCPNLKTLHLTGVEVESLEPLGSLAQLEWLVTKVSPSASLAPLAQLPNLKRFEVRDSPLEGKFEPLSALKVLEDLILSSCGVRDLSSLGELENLTNLALPGNRIEDLTPLARLRNLKGLNLSHNPIRDVEALGELRALETLSVHHCVIEDLSPLANLTGLKFLNASYTSVRDGSFLQNLTALETLIIENTKLESLPPLKNCSRLQEIHMAGHFVRDSTPFAGLESLNTVNVSYGPLRDLASFSSCPRLTTLLARQTQVRSTTACESVASLVNVSLMQNQLRGLEGFRSHRNLKNLNLYENSIEDLSPLLENPNVGSGLRLNLGENPLSEHVREVQIPELLRRGVEVYFDLITWGE